MLLSRSLSVFRAKGRRGEEDGIAGEGEGRDRKRIHRQRVSLPKRSGERFLSLIHI